MSEMPDITQEVWTVATDGREDDPVPYIFLIREPGPPPHGDCIAKVLNQEGSRARADMLARAPTLFRLLEQVLQVCHVPDDLREVIEINLYRASPEKRPKPELRARTRRDAWSRLLDEDVLGEPSPAPHPNPP